MSGQERIETITYTHQDFNATDDGGTAVSASYPQEAQPRQVDIEGRTSLRLHMSSLSLEGPACTCPSSPQRLWGPGLRVSRPIQLQAQEWKI